MFGLPSFNLASFNPWSIAPYVIAVPLIFAAGAFWDGDRREGNISNRLARDFNKTAVVSELACMTDKAQAWEEVRNGRAILGTWMARFERIMDASDQERAAFRSELRSSAVAVKAARDQANETMARLDNARSDLETAWRDGHIPAGIMCGVLKSPGCPEVSGHPAGAAADGAVGLQPGPAGPHAPAPAGGGGAALPAGSAADRPADVRGQQ